MVTSPSRKSAGTLEVRQGGARVWLRAIRVHQWSKNGLLAVPVAAAHLPPGGQVALALLRAFLAFSLLASALYLVNDLLDLEHDRAHPVKSQRPLASGSITPAAGMIAAGGLLLVSALLARSLPLPFQAVWAAYLVLTSAYSFAFKRVVMLDVITLAALYTVRLVAGATAVDVPLSRWFLAFSVFLFTSLAMLKRMVETKGAAARDVVALAGRGWRVADAPVLLAFGAGAATAAALVYCLYITGPDVANLYRRPDMLWLALPVLLYWIGRVWLLALRGEVHEDPILFALKDRVSYLVLVIFASVVWMAS